MDRSPTTPNPPSRKLAPPAQAAADWFRLLARTFKVRRLYRPDNPILAQMREQLHRTLADDLRRHGAWNFQVTPSEILLGDEFVIRPRRSIDGQDVRSSPEEQLPFLFYADGIRGLTVLPGIPQHDTDAFLEALQAAGGLQSTGDDLVTLLWQANASHLKFDVVPLEQTIHLYSAHGSGGLDEGENGLTFAWSPAGAEVRAELRQLAGTRGLHRDALDAWALPVDFVNVRDAYDRLLPQFEDGRKRLRADWAAESNFDWRLQIPATFRHTLALSPGEGTARDLAHAAITWIENAIERAAWDEAAMALGLFEELQVDHDARDRELAAILCAADVHELTERLDESPAWEQGRFFAFLVSVGPQAIDLAFAVLAESDRGRTRAAAVTALSYLIGDEPARIAPILRDPRWFVVRNAVFILGQIGGSGAADLIASVARHPEPRVRRAVVEALGNAPIDQRIAILAPMLDTTDIGLLAAQLNMLTRERDPRVATILLERVQDREFAVLGEEARALLLQTLGDVDPAKAIPILQQMLHRGGWFARRSYERTAAARILSRIATPEALQVLENGMRARAESVRLACREGTSRRAAA